MGEDLKVCLLVATIAAAPASRSRHHHRTTTNVANGAAPPISAKRIRQKEINQAASSL